MANCLRDMEIILRYITYAMYLGDVSVLNDRCLNGLKETYLALGIPTTSVGQVIEIMKEISISICNDPQDVTLGDCSNLIAELSGYFDCASAALDGGLSYTEVEELKNALSNNMLTTYTYSVQIANSPSGNYEERQVFFATDRNRTKSKVLKEIYGGKRNSTGKLEFGIAKISIPIDHRKGRLEKPQWYKLVFSGDPSKHIKLLNVEIFEQNKFLDHLHVSLDQLSLSERDLLIFIHGFDTSFEDSVRRTAQIAYDLDFRGPAILYSWPSEAKFAQYITDETNIEWTTPHLEEFLLLLMKDSGASAINAIAHSMGNRALARVVKDIDRSNLPEGAATLRHIVFAAPDIDAGTFRQFAQEFSQQAQRLTLYASSKDVALKLSKKLHGDYPRAGESGNNLVIVSDVDTIDATHVDTGLFCHSYVGDSRSILNDIFYLLKHDVPPDERFGLVRKTFRNLCFWLFQP
jgi:esterase/lipase superfamily enzyme